MSEALDKFIQILGAGYPATGSQLVLGAPLLGDFCSDSTPVRLPLKTLNRHGLIAGATGTGKTKTLQVLAEQLSLAGVPSLLMDIKGDLSGLAAPGAAGEKTLARHQRLGIPYEPQALPVELLSLGDGAGVRMRATVSEFGPVLLGRILDLNDTQQSVLSLVFKFCDDRRLPLVDLKDMRSVLQHITTEGRDEVRREFGQVSSATTGIILRKIMELEQQGADQFFGEPSFDPQDLLELRDGKGVLHIVRLIDLQDRPRLFSTFMLCLLAEIYATFPEVGDLEKPKLVLFIDEAHLIFRTASKALLEQLETIVKLIRSKGVGVIFCTQDPTDVPEAVLGQLGLKVQHALRAFTAKDRTAIKRTAENYPISSFYRTDELLTQLGIGEALVTALSEKGTPTPLAHVLLRAPITRMDVLSTLEVDGLVARSQLATKYGQDLDRESAHELLKKRIAEATPPPTPTAKTTHRAPAPPRSTLEEITRNPMARQVGNTIVRELTRGLLGVLGLRSTSRRRR
ncbi:MAG: DUF853 family protein [Flavobacteriales bacterium]|nr:DUF853 family protein [Flavobacteriales bacterium]